MDRGFRIYNRGPYYREITVLYCTTGLYKDCEDDEAQNSVGCSCCLRISKLLKLSAVMASLAPHPCWLCKDQRRVTDGAAAKSLNSWNRRSMCQFAETRVHRNNSGGAPLAVRSSRHCVVVPRAASGLNLQSKLFIMTFSEMAFYTCQIITFELC